MQLIPKKKYLINKYNACIPQNQILILHRQITLHNQPVHVILIVADALAQNGHQVISNRHAVTTMPIEHIRHCISRYTKYEFESRFVLRIYRYSQIENIQENTSTWFFF